MSDNSSQLELAERLQRRRARLMLAQVLIFVFWQISFFASLSDLEGPRRAVQEVKISAFIVWAGLLLLLLATGGNWWSSREVRRLANDEVTREHFRSAHVWGYWAVMLSCFVIYVLQLFTPVSVMIALHMLLSVGIVLPLARFVYLERRSNAAE